MSLITRIFFYEPHSVVIASNTAADTVKNIISTISCSPLITRRDACSGGDWWADECAVMLTSWYVGNLAASDFRFRPGNISTVKSNDDTSPEYPSKTRTEHSRPTVFRWTVLAMSARQNVHCHRRSLGSWPETVDCIFFPSNTAHELMKYFNLKTFFGQYNIVWYYNTRPPPWR